MRYVLLIYFLFSPWISYGQAFTDSNLPIVIINTDIDPNTGAPAAIPDLYKVGADMKIIFRPDGSRNYTADQTNAAFLNYNGRIAIELRGSTSQTRPKKPFGLTTFKSDNIAKNNVSLLGMPEENDWILHSLPFDASLIRSYLSYELARSIGSYATRGVYCELILNGRYSGLYMLMEKIKIDPERVNIVKMAETDNALPELSGGYLVKADKTSEGETVSWYMASYNGRTGFLFENPDAEIITSEQKNYIINYFTTFQQIMTAQNSSITDGYPSVIDIPSFIDFMILNELSSNADAYQYSTFFHKDRSGKLRAGPVWDFDLTYGNDLFLWNFDRSHYDVWQFDNKNNTGARFWKDLFDNELYRCYLSKRWKELNAGNGPLNYQSLSAKIDQIVAHISEAAVRENERWKTIPNHAQEITKMKEWLQHRINWLNSNLNNTSACNHPIIPPLVISKINYNPLPSSGYTDNDLEFIEITNLGNEPVDLSGIYFRELGLTYMFPANSSVAASSKVFLAGNSAAFQRVYGFAPFGQFTRNLSNRSEDLVLADAFGNIIDHVEYHNKNPWPAEANGKGYYLQLKDLNSDNNLAANWTISKNVILDSAHVNSQKNIKIYPNPTRTDITVESGEDNMVSFEIFDIRGRKIMWETIQGTKVILNTSHLAPNIYLMKIYFIDGETVVLKINKLP